RGLSHTLTTLSVLTDHLERRQNPFIRSRLRVHEQPLIAHYLIEHDVRFEEIHPGLRVEQLALPDGPPVLALAPAVALRCVDPDGCLRPILGPDETRGPEACGRAEQRHAADQPLEAQNRAQRPPPIDSSFRLGTAPRRADGWHRWRNHHRWSGTRG